MSEPVPVTVKILDREYRVACPEEERHALLSAASYLDRKMRELRDGGRVVGLDRIAVVTALNIANELLQVRADGDEYTRVIGSRVKAINQKLDGALSAPGS